MATIASIDSTKARRNDSAGIRSRRICDYVGPSSYPNTGATVGDPFAASLVQLGTIESWGGSGSAIASDGTNIRICVFRRNTTGDLGSGVVRWFVPNTGSEVANGVDLSGYRVQGLEVIGK